MGVLRRERWRWGGPYGDTHTGHVWFLLGVPVWRRRRPLHRRA